MIRITAYIFITAILSSCVLMDGGTHGSIKGYQYQVSKVELQKAVINALNQDPGVYMDYRKDYYNDTKNYVTMYIKEGKDKTSYVFRYLGDSLYWKSSSSSEIFLCYIYDGKGNGGSEGNGKWKKTSKNVRRKMLELFETQFIRKVDSVLVQKHVEVE